MMRNLRLVFGTALALAAWTLLPLVLHARQELPQPPLDEEVEEAEAAVAATEAAGQPVQPATQGPRVSRLQGRVALSRREFVVGATVLVHPGASRAEQFLTATGHRGAFKIDDLPDGEYSVELRREGLAPVRKDEVSLKFPFRAVVEVSMQPSAAGDETATGNSAGGAAGQVAVIGKVAEIDGDPLGEVNVRLVRSDGSEDPRALRTRPDGGFEIQDLPAGRWRVEIEGVGFLRLEAPVALDQDTRLKIFMVRQPSGYTPTPTELMPTERPVPPAGWNHG